MQRKSFRYVIVMKTKIWLRWKNHKEFKILRKVTKLGDKMFQHEKIAWDESDNFSKVIIVFLAKNLHRLRSVMILCKKGLAKDAVPLLRAMFEDLVDFKYLETNKSFIDDFFDYDSYSKLRLGKMLLGAKNINIDRQKVQKRNNELQKEWDKVKYKFKNTKGKICQRWSCKNVKEVSVAVGLGEAYDWIFGYLSHYIHSTTISASSYVLGVNKDRKTVAVGVGTSMEIISEVLATVSVLFIDMLDLVNNDRGINFDSKLKEISEQLQSGDLGFKTSPPTTPSTPEKTYC